MLEKRKKDEYTIGNTRVETFSGGGQPNDMVLSPIRPNTPNVRRNTFVARPEAPEAPKALQEPTLLTKENSTLGWQARIAANRDLMDNYRTQLQTTTQAGIAGASDRSALERTRASNASAEQIAAGSNAAAAARQAAGATSEAALLGTKISAEEQMKEADRAFTEKQTGRREVFDQGMEERKQQAILDAQREVTGAELFSKGAFESPEAYQNFTRMGSVGGMKVPTQQRELKYIEPVFEKTSDPNATPRMLVPPKVFDPAIGEVKEILEDVPTADAIAMAEERLAKLKKKREEE
jgi:hypothetical protein